MEFGAFMAGWFGRTIRIAAGLALIGVGLFLVKGARGAFLALIGLVPLLAGAFDVCVLAPLLQLPFKGADVRKRVNAPPTTGGHR